MTSVRLVPMTLVSHSRVSWAVGFLSELGYEEAAAALDELRLAYLAAPADPEETVTSALIVFGTLVDTDRDLAIRVLSALGLRVGVHHDNGENHMRKIPTLFKRDPDDMRRLLPQVHDDCAWVLAGEGIATRKFDGTCVGYFDGEWLARREVKPGKAAPPGFLAQMTDPATGKTVGWEPIAQSPFAKFHAEAIENARAPLDEGTYELCGPKVQGNPERFAVHTLIPHATAQVLDAHPASIEDARDMVLAYADHGYEGIVWHHPDGRMAKLKARDFDA